MAKLPSDRQRLTAKREPKPEGHRYTSSVSLLPRVKEELRKMGEEEGVSLAKVIEGLLEYYKKAEGLNDDKTL